jgi:hypothetical protein
MDTYESQRKQVLRFLQVNGSITPDEAEELCASHRLASIIHRLRNSGHAITTENAEGINRFGQKVHFARYHYHEPINNN